MITMTALEFVTAELSQFHAEHTRYEPSAKPDERTLEQWRHAFDLWEKAQ
jgi:hypothetical protein